MPRPRERTTGASIRAILRPSAVAHRPVVSASARDPMTSRQNQSFPTPLQIAGVVGAVIAVVAVVWLLSSATAPGAPAPSSGVGLTSQLPGASGIGSLAPGSSAGPGSSVGPGSSFAPGSSVAPGSTPTTKPTAKPTPKPTPKPTAKPVTKIKLALAYSGFSKPVFITGAH